MALQIPHLPLLRLELKVDWNYGRSKGSPSLSDRWKWGCRPHFLMSSLLGSYLQIPCWAQQCIFSRYVQSQCFWTLVRGKDQVCVFCHLRVPRTNNDPLAWICSEAMASSNTLDLITLQSTIAFPATGSGA